MKHSIHSFKSSIYVAPLQKNYSEALATEVIKRNTELIRKPIIHFRQLSWNGHGLNWIVTLVWLANKRGLLHDCGRTIPLEELSCNLRHELISLSSANAGWTFYPIVVTTAVPCMLSYLIPETWQSWHEGLWEGSPDVRSPVFTEHNPLSAVIGIQGIWITCRPTC